MDGAKYQNLTTYLTLSLIPQLGPARIKCLQESLGDLSILLKEIPASVNLPQASVDALRAIIKSPNHPISERVKQALDQLQKTPRIHAIALTDPDYPPLLYDISAPPPILFVDGNLNALALPQLAIVGTRRPTVGGSETAHEFARFLVQNGFAVVSGLALGIDTAAHSGALAGQGVTLAILGSGLDRVYPARNRALAQEIVAAGGAVVSEYLPGTAPEASNFPRRNRIISGLSLGTMVVEATVKSGSLITARYALEQQREVFAVPGSIHNPMSRGCHSLIRAGASLVETAQDIVTELGGGLAYLKEQAANNTLQNSPQHWLLEHLGFDPVSLDTLVSRSEAPVEQVTSELLGLELEGLVSQRGGLFYRH